MIRTITHIDGEGNYITTTLPNIEFDNHETPAHTIYSDRLLQWDFAKHDRLCRKHWNNCAQHWSDRKPSEIEAFLRDWLNDPTVVLCRIEALVNHSNGFPLWRFDYRIDPVLVA